MNTQIAPLEVVQTVPADDEEHWHIVCHCTDDNFSACGLDCSASPWSDDDDEGVCVLCELAWPDGAPSCPWGCSCDECGPGAIS